MDLVIFTSIVTALRGVLGLANDLAKADDDRREKIAAWMQELGEIVNFVADKLELNQYPHQACGAMSIMVDKFPIIVGDIIPRVEVLDMQTKLRSAIEIERLYGEFVPLDQNDRLEHINTLLNLSGQLKGLSSLIKYAE